MCYADDNCAPLLLKAACVHAIWPVLHKETHKKVLTKKNTILAQTSGTIHGEHAVYSHGNLWKLQSHCLYSFDLSFFVLKGIAFATHVSKLYIFFLIMHSAYEIAPCKGVIKAVINVMLV